MTQIQIATFRAKMIHATSTPVEQQRQLDALRGVVLGLLGLGIDAGAVASPGPLGGPGCYLGGHRQN